MEEIVSIRSMPTKVADTPLSVAVRYIATIGKAVARYEKKVAPIDREIEELEKRLEYLKAKREQAKPLISKLVRKFHQFAERYRFDLTRDRTKLVKTPAGDFKWALNRKGILCSKKDELPVVNELLRLGKFNLLRYEVKRSETVAAVENGELKGARIPVGQRERFVVYPTGTLPVTICGEDPVRIGKEQLEE